MYRAVFPAGYVGLGTVGAATWWYLFDEEGPQVSFYQLVSCIILLNLLCTISLSSLRSPLSDSNEGDLSSLQK